jgi:hypothetical protein
MAKFTNMPGAMKGMGTFSKIKEDAAFHGSKRARQGKVPIPPGTNVGDNRPAGKIKDTSPMSTPKITGVGGFRPLGSPAIKRHFGN